MTEIILSGGLGNQMFQYAAGRALSLRTQAALFADTYLFKKQSKSTARLYELDIFELQLPIKNCFSTILLAKGYKYCLSNPFGRRLYRMANVFNESAGPHSYDENFSRLGKNSTLFGYFQNERYFSDYSQQIRTDFIFKEILTGENLLASNCIKECNSVSIHIRRGDYLHPNANMAVLDTGYYRKAIQLVTERCQNPCFFVFSDDMEWARTNLDFGSFQHYYIDWNTGSNSHIDMRLISLCKHNITANSSFSWWGAWLNSNPDKIVIAPSTWWKIQSDRVLPEGFIPEGWIVL
jgi:hypothetical protein